MNPLHIIQLGRLGDLASILPGVAALSRTRHVRFFVSRPFADFVEGAAPFELVDVPFRCDNVKAALILSRSMGPSEEVVTQVCGNHGLFCKGASYATDSWARLPSAPCDWAEARPLPRRDFASEKWLAAFIEEDPETSPLVNLTGVGAPVPRGDALYSEIVRHFGSAVNLGALHARKPQDLLGLYDRHRLLITADTFTLHLAKNHPTLKVVQLVPSISSWFSTPRIPNAIRYMGYDEAIATADAWLPLLRKQI